MKPEELEAIGRAAFGDNWIVDMAKKLEYSHSTVWRWSTGATTPSRHAAKAIRALARRKKVADNRK